MRDEIKGVMREVFNVGADAIPDEISQKNFEKWDSLTHLNLIIALESRFDISFEPEEISAMTSLGAIEGLLARKNK